MVYALAKLSFALFLLTALHLNLHHKHIQVKQLGFVAYDEAWALQRQLQQHVVDIKVGNRSLAQPQPTPNYLIACSHPPTLTLGRSANPANLLHTRESMAAQGVAVYDIERGGDITCHEPGQLVLYPILDLENFFTDLARYLRNLEEVVIRTLADFGIAAGRLPGYTGVWLEPDSEKARKICAMGIKCSRWVTMHGLALNVNNHLKHFRLINPCGITDRPVTSMCLELDTLLDHQAVQQLMLHHFAEVFEARLLPSSL